MTPKKIKIIDQETGHTIREGFARASDIGEPKVLGLFSPADLVRTLFVTICMASTVGGMWVNTNDHFKSIDVTTANLSKSLDDFKATYWTGHKELMNNITASKESQDSRINCLSGNQKAVCATIHLEGCQTC